MDHLLRSYKILRLKPGASLAEVRQAHRDAAWLWHPDRFPREPYIQEKARARMREINAAYQSLKTHLLEKATGPLEVAAPSADAALSGTGPGSTAGSILPLIRTGQIWFREHAGILALGLALATGLFLSPLIYNYLTSPSQPAATTAQEAASVPPASGAIQGGKPAPPAAAPQNGAKAGSPARPTLPTPKGHFTLGSSQYEVWAVQGPPQHILHNTWKYGLSTVTFKNRRVVSYLNISRNLRVRLAPGVPAAAGRGPVHFTVGSSKDRVLAVQGTPTGVVGNTWKYGESEVKFRGDRVVAYANTGHNLEVRAPSRPRTARKASRKYFTLGSSKRRVLAVQGYPTYVWGNTWWYGYSQIIFYGDRVIGFADVSRNLKARMI
ncbi:MAG: J domain-containing protein [Thermodesulfobacteriota bacterium]